MIVKLAINLTINFIMSSTWEWHLAAGTSEAIIVPVSGVVLVVEVLTRGNRLATACANQGGGETVSVFRAEWTAINNREL